MELTGSIQKYAWGKKGSSSLVAQLAQSTGALEVKESENYAELWIGTHPSGPAVVSATSKPLSDLIKEDPKILGEKVVERFGPSLPFLLKVLSVEKALSIQAHPDLELGKKLHETFPDIYKDPNHKPEMAIAITPFEVMCGFRDVGKIVQYLKDVSELREVIGEEAAKSLESNPNKSNLKLVFSKLMKSDKSVVAAQLDKLRTRLNDLDESDLIKRLMVQYPGDVGIFSVFFLQHILLQPGEAVFLPANEPHAYIFGDCVECMATSDNVVRAGLTPKYIDVETLTEMLTYEHGRDWVVRGTKLPSGASLYNTPVPEFALREYSISERTKLDPQEDSCSVLLFITGEGKLNHGNESKDIKPGTIIFLPFDPSASVEVVPESAKVLIYEAFATP